VTLKVSSPPSTQNLNSKHPLYQIDGPRSSVFQRSRSHLCKLRLRKFSLLLALKSEPQNSELFCVRSMTRNSSLINDCDHLLHFGSSLFVMLKASSPPFFRFLIFEIHHTDQWSTTPHDLRAHIKSRTQTSRVPTTLTFDFSSLRVSEMMISHHVSYLNGRPGFLHNFGVLNDSWDYPTCKST
jgi:hypothetical protein